MGGTSRAACCECGDCGDLGGRLRLAGVDGASGRSGQVLTAGRHLVGSQRRHGSSPRNEPHPHWCVKIGVSIARETRASTPLRRPLMAINRPAFTPSLTIFLCPWHRWAHPFRFHSRKRRPGSTDGRRHGGRQRGGAGRCRRALAVGRPPDSRRRLWRRLALRGMSPEPLRRCCRGLYFF